jgi:hypothetical protein
MPYLLDSDVLMEARKKHYGFDICPGFWDWIVAQHATGAVLSVEKVRDEIGAGNDVLVTWAASQPETFFASVDAATLSIFPRVSAWATGQNYTQGAAADFLQKADYYLVAHALAHRYTVVTHEVASASVNKIKIPDACNGLGVQFINPFEMLRREKARFIL